MIFEDQQRFPAKAKKKKKEKSIKVMKLGQSAMEIFENQFDI